MGIDVNQVKQFAIYVDKKVNGGNGNGYVDGSEVSEFKKKIKTVDRSIDVDSIFNTYKNDKVSAEAGYDKDNSEATTVEDAIIAALNPNSALNNQPESKNQATTIIAGLKDADAQSHWYNPVSWFNDNEEVLNFTGMITKDNVLDVIEDEEALDKIVDSEDEVREQAGIQIIDALVAAAAERKIDVSNIVFKNEEGKYVVGRDVKDGDDNVEFGSDALDEDSIKAVITALKAEIEQGKETATGNDSDKDAVLTMLAKRIDADTSNGGNNNGYIDSAAEVAAFKQAAATQGYDIGTVLEEIRANEADGVENTTGLQKTVANIFDPTQRAEKQKAIENQAKDTAKAFKDGIENDNEDLIKTATSMLNSDNVMEVLNENPELVEKLVDEYDYFWMFWKDDSYQNYTTPILKAVIENAKENGINIDDIVMVNGDKYLVGGNVDGAKVGKDATDADNVAKVIKAIQDRINEQNA